MLALLTRNTESGLSFWEKLSAWYEQSVIYEIFAFLKEQYFTLEFGIYENFSVADGLGTTVRNIIIAIALALIAVSVMNAYTRQNLGGFVRRLISEDCLSPDRAKTLSELGYFRSTSIRRALARGTTLRLVVRRAETEEMQTAQTADNAQPESVEDVVPTDADNARDNGEVDATDATPCRDNGNAEVVTRATEKDTKIDFLTARFYVPEELRYRAEIRFRVKGSSWWLVALTAVVAVVVAALLCRLLPDVVAFADNLMTWLSPS